MKQLLIFLFLLPTMVLANCDILLKYHSLCNYKTHSVPNFIVDTYGIDGGEELIIDYLRNKNGSITKGSFSEKDRFRMQEILNLALQGNSDAMVMLAKAYKNKDWKKYWLNKAAEKNNLIALTRLRMMASKEKKSLNKDKKYLEKYLKLKAIISLYKKRSKLSKYYKDKIEYELYKYKYGWKRRLLQRIKNDIDFSQDVKETLNNFPSKQKLLNSDNIFILDDLSKRTYGNDFLKLQNIKAPNILFRKALCAAGLDSFYYMGYVKSGKLCPDNVQYDINKSLKLIHESSVLENQIKNSASTGSGWKISSKNTEAENILSILEVMLMMPVYFDNYKIDFKVFNAYTQRYLKLKYNINKYDKKTLNNFFDDVKTNLVLMLNDPILKLNPYSTNEQFFNIIKNIQYPNYYISKYYKRYYEQASKVNEFEKDDISRFKKSDRLYSLIFGYITRSKLYNQQKRKKFYQLLSSYYHKKGISIDKHLKKIEKKGNLAKNTMEFFKILGKIFKEMHKKTKKEFYEKFKVAKNKANYFFEKSLVEYYKNSLVPLRQNKYFLESKKKLDKKYHSKDSNNPNFLKWAQSKDSELYFKELSKLRYKYELKNLKNILLGNKSDEYVESYIEIVILLDAKEFGINYKNNKEGISIFKNKIDKLLNNNLQLIAKKNGSIYALEFNGTLKREDYYRGLDYYLPNGLSIFLYGYDPYTYLKKILIRRYFDK